ncbi:MAG TPA: LPS export ABC transporter periplasmic protein LptC [Stellaceae bacterium]|nr:LPS export ABC transporter periplasmic protein LptC [Stellaceae bacterium]
MIGRNTARALGASGRLLRPGNAVTAVNEWLSGLPGNRYSRRVALLKVALPALGTALLLLVVVWPRVAPLFERFRFAAIDLREARELRMISPRYAGTDRNGRPYVITAAVGRQVPQRDDVMALDQPVANLRSHSGAKIVISADSGVYQTQTQFLDAFGSVTLSQEDGSTFKTSSARLDVANSAAEGHAPIEGHGPRGDVTGEGFRIIDKGDIVIFTGHSTAFLKSVKEGTPAAPPPAVPAPIAQAAAQIETKVQPTHPAAARHAAHAAAAKPAPHHPAKKPAHHKPAAKKQD